MLANRNFGRAKTAWGSSLWRFAKCLKAIRYYRSWTGICFAEAYYEKLADGYRITELRINNNPKEYQLNDIDAAVALFYGLLVNEYGGFASPYRKAAF